METVSSNLVLIFVHGAAGWELSWVKYLDKNLKVLNKFFKLLLKENEKYVHKTEVSGDITTISFPDK